MVEDRMLGDSTPQETASNRRTRARPRPVRGLRLALRQAERLWRRGRFVGREPCRSTLAPTSTSTSTSTSTLACSCLDAGCLGPRHRRGDLRLWPRQGRVATRWGGRGATACRTRTGTGDRDRDRDRDGGRCRPLPLGRFPVAFLPHPRRRSPFSPARGAPESHSRLPIPSGPTIDGDCWPLGAAQVQTLRPPRRGPCPSRDRPAAPVGSRLHLPTRSPPRESNPRNDRSTFSRGSTPPRSTTNSRAPSSSERRSAPRGQTVRPSPPRGSTSCCSGPADGRSTPSATRTPRWWTTCSSPPCPTARTAPSTAP